MGRINKGSKGFTLMELMVVVAILGVLMAIVAPAVTGTKSASLESQTKSDADAVQKATDNFNNKSIKSGAFPELALSVTGATNPYADVYAVGTAGAGVTLLDKNGSAKGTGETLATVITKSGSAATVAKRMVIDFSATTDIYDANGSVKTAIFVPDFLMKSPSSIPLKGDETKALGDTGNTYEEFLWLYQVNSPGSIQESRNVEIYRMTKATIAGTPAAVTALEYTQIY